MTDLSPQPFRHYATGRPMPTRWADNDMFGHLNNATYYELFDTAINSWVAEQTGTRFTEQPVIGVVAESACRFHSEVSFPGLVTVALRVDRLGRTSVTYGLGLFSGDAPAPEDVAAATARWVHVYVDRRTKNPTALPDGIRAALGRLADKQVDPAR